ncbi:MAG TPA: glycosyltransferase family 1 protein [Methyloprofundus sp.]|uniref:glycosyltransferase family 4 protein n=1 Tax=Methyloprofundus sp. TaxID=2020875 RepID=UPI0017D17D48|nr:glycosyltransferase family 4 protein [Methyloprofundus sp.]HIG66144.1 glycosyltransferase family 1 protein [Methyloprofundus sp.]HIL77852.1 glycosyltransferase family 1 protein [Methylococcales bacterium]
MKIWIPSIKTGSGSDVYVKRLAESLSNLGMNVDLQWFPLYFEFCPLLLRRIKPPEHTHIIFANSWSACGFTHHDIPVVSVVHHCVHDPSYRPFKSTAQAIYHRLVILPYEKAGLQRANAVVSGSQFTQKKVQEVFNIKPELIYYSIDPQHFQSLTNQQAKKRPPFKLLFIGNQSKRKGFDLLDNIMEKLGPEYILYFTSGLRNQSEEQSIPHSHCLGLLSDQELIEAYHNSDALLFPTRYEGFGYAAAEAMACGLPVITTDCASIPELIDDEKGGFLCPVDDVDAFVAKIKLLADSLDLAKKMGEYNRNKAVTCFNPDRMGREYISLFERLVAKDN